MWIVIFIVILCILIGVFVAKNKQSDSLLNSASKPQSYGFNIVGEASYQNNLKTIAGPKQELSKSH